MKQISLADNTHYIKEGVDTISYSAVLPELDRTKSEELKFLKTLSCQTIERLNSSQKEDGGILVWPHSFKEQKSDLSKMKVLDCSFLNDGTIESISTNNLVGFIGNGKVQIEIGTRFCKKHNMASETDYLLYYMLSKVFHMNIVNMEVGRGTLKELDLLIFMFPQLLQEAMRQGIFKQYVKREYNDSNLRGTIDINRHIRYNYPANGRIAYNTREFSHDNYVTQLIRHTIEHIGKSPIGRNILNINKETEECVRNIRQSTPTFQSCAKRSVIAGNRKVVSHPYFTKYRTLQQLCLAILRNERISHGKSTNKVHGVLIDVAWLWEEYVANILREYDCGFNHHTDKNSFKLFSNVESDKPFQTIIPDYLHADKFVADAKYIPLHRYEHLDAERASAVYYKTIMYMYRFATSKGFLFHPCSMADEKENKFAYSEYEIANNKNCHLYEIGLVVPDSDDFTEFKHMMINHEEEFCKKVKELTA